MRTKAIPVQDRDCYEHAPAAFITPIQTRHRLALALKPPRIAVVRNDRSNVYVVGATGALEATGIDTTSSVVSVPWCSCPIWHGAVCEKEVRSTGVFLARLH